MSIDTTDPAQSEAIVLSLSFWTLALAYLIV